MSYAVWESVAAFKAAFEHPDFRRHIESCPRSTVSWPHLFSASLSSSGTGSASVKGSTAAFAFSVGSWYVPARDQSGRSRANRKSTGDDTLVLLFGASSGAHGRVDVDARLGKH
jgi:hypothetical protein